jgi:mannosyl-oligosaccharide alpha-1,2-mannosidase
VGLATVGDTGETARLVLMWSRYGTGEPQTAPLHILVSELGSLSLEFTRLSQLTRDPKYYDAVQRISDALEKAQNTTKLPGMWPVSVDASKPSFDEDTFFSLGGMSDSLYEYFPKQYLILGGLKNQPKALYEGFIEVAKKKMFFRFFNPKNEPLLASGDVRIKGTAPNLESELHPRAQHLTCFTGGMVGLASKIFDRPNDLSIAEELTAGCVWAYDHSAHGIAPEIYSVLPCPKDKDCTWSKQVWHDALETTYSLDSTSTSSHNSDRENNINVLIYERKLPQGFMAIDDRRYILRPEAIESVFIMWRITGDRKWQDAAWRMFESIEKVTRTDIAASAIWDITVDPVKDEVDLMDSMESFWLAETLKYFYLCFQDFDVVSLDDYVLNTEAHPLKRPGR